VKVTHPIPDYALVETAAGTCSGVTPNNDATITVSGIDNANRIGISAGGIYTGPDYASATPIVGSSHVFTGLTHGSQYTIRLFNLDDTTYVDIDTVSASITCLGNPSYVSATANLGTCTLGVANDDASITVTGITNGDKIGISTGLTYTGPSYASAITLVGTDYTFTGLVHTETYTIRIFNASDANFTDVTRTAPFISCPPVPTYATATSSAGTCTAGAPNNDATINITGISNGNKIGISTGATYTGPNYASATFLAGSSYTFTALAHNTQYTVRIFNLSDSSYVDIVITTADIDCPDYATATGAEGTCTGATPNNDASITVTGIVNANRIGISVGPTYTGPNYAGAFTLTGSSYTFNGLQHDLGYVIRLFNLGSTNTLDISVSTPEITCATLPTYGTVSTVDATCSNGNPLQNATITVSSIVNADRIGISTGVTYSGPSYASATTIVGGSHTFTGLFSDTPYVIRLFNGDDDAVTDIVTETEPVTCMTASVSKATLSENVTYIIAQPGTTTIGMQKTVADNQITLVNKWRAYATAPSGVVVDTEVDLPATGEYLTTQIGP